VGSSRSGGGPAPSSRCGMKGASPVVPSGPHSPHGA